MEGHRSGDPERFRRHDRRRRRIPRDPAPLAEAFPQIPAPIVAISATTAAVALFRVPVETIGSRFGEIPMGIPRAAPSALDLASVRELFPSGDHVALLAGIESLLSAVVADGMIGSRHKSNVELVAQGVANMASAAFGGIPAAGAIARTATNIKNGGRTPVAGIVHALTILLVLLFFGRWAASSRWQRFRRSWSWWRTT